ncbi:beta and beta-prime subunits of DNA dependent RNA-polymerase [Coprinellus micaceus]|uniref:DNA-directed RNA polymerase subunit n=1 Tax=Coprinellus micaceus TaxID=71717 RepID=A0A4Y7TA19_COPMI|nr:beta and beta-prime subunits of DNA dependent RNA-polymerase [Coprinellus micaceus]
MLGHQFAYSAAPIRKVKEVQFGILAPEEIKAISVAKIEHPEVMDETKIGGLMDPRMETIDRNFKCQTCGEGMAQCPGHFGHIVLARPVFHPDFIMKAKKILESICVNCCKLEDDIVSRAFCFPYVIYATLRPRMAVVWAYCKTKTVRSTDESEEGGAEGEGEEPKKGHGGCGHIQPVIQKEGLKMFVQYKKTKDDDDEMKSLQPDKRQITPAEIYTVFKKISDHDLHLLGLSDEYARPEWMILTVLPVPPPPDDLTYKLGDILKASANARRCEQEGAPAHVISEFEQLLQFHTATYMDNNVTGIPQALQKSGRPGKEGRLRGNLMGKRDDFSARTVITGDPNLELDEVGVPTSIVVNLTLPEQGGFFYIVLIASMLIHSRTRPERPNDLPGARYVIRDTGERIDLRYNKRADAFLQYGWIVERHLKDGDYVLFNRKPSLHKMSMMSHRVRLTPYSTFRLNLSVTPPYTADFNGDEMNMHVPQSKETRAELSQIAWIISPQANKPVMGIVQNTLCSIRKFTLRDCFMDWNAVQNILLWVPDWDGTVPIPAIHKPKPLWTGKQILSMAIPKGINTHRAPDPRSSNPTSDDSALIENGELTSGIVEKKTVGASQGGLVHVVFRENGPEVTKTLFTGLQMVVNHWLFHNGFSIGIGDTIADANTMSYITKTISENGMTLRESFESSVETVLNKARDTSGQYAQKHLKDNNVKQMVVAGSKGCFINTSQMSVCVGQRSVEGKRIPFGFRHRSLPHFESRGFVENSYLRGLTPQEFFFHAMAGREGLIDTAVKTAETGYIHRRFVKALEDVMVCYGGTVRNSLGDLIQFVYGEDGMDRAFIEKQSIETFTLDNAEFQHKYRVDVTDPAGRFMAGVLQVGVNDSSTELQEKLDQEFAQLEKDRHDLRHFISPAPLPPDLEPAYIVDSVRELGESREEQENATLMFKMHLRATFAARKVLEQYHLTKEAFRWVLGDNPDELNTFHYAGVSSKNVTLGVPRLEEIINVTTSIKNPSLTIHLEPQIATAAALAKNVQQGMAFTSLRTITAAVEIWYDPDVQMTVIDEDELFVESLFAIPDEDIESKLHLQSPSLLGPVLDRSKVLDRELTMQYVASKIVECFKSDLFVIWSEDNSEKLVIRCRVLGGLEKDEDEDGMGVEEDIFLRQLESTMLNSVNLRGVKGINRVFLTPSEKVIIDGESAIHKQKDEEWILETDGTNLKAVMTVDDVDASRTYSNNCVEVFNVLGIEAARSAIMKEIRNVIEFDGSYVNYQHLGLLCDLMTHRGSLMAITRHNDCHGIAENVMFGQMAPMGTGAFEVALGIDMLKDAIVDHRLPVQSVLAAQIDGSMTPGHVAMTPYDTNSPEWQQDGLFQGNPMSAAFSPLASNGAEDAANFQYSALPQSPHLPRPGATSPTYSPNSPAPNVGGTSPNYSPMGHRYSPRSSPNYSPTSPRYSPQPPRLARPRRPVSNKNVSWRPSSRRHHRCCHGH